MQIQRELTNFIGLQNYYPSCETDSFDMAEKWKPKNVMLRTNRSINQIWDLSGFLDSEQWPCGVEKEERSKEYCTRRFGLVWPSWCDLGVTLAAAGDLVLSHAHELCHRWVVHGGLRACLLRPRQHVRHVLIQITTFISRQAGRSIVKSWKSH